MKKWIVAQDICNFLLKQGDGGSYSQVYKHLESDFSVNDCLKSKTNVHDQMQSILFWDEFPLMKLPSVGVCL